MRGLYFGTGSTLNNKAGNVRWPSEHTQQNSQHNFCGQVHKHNRILNTTFEIIRCSEATNERVMTVPRILQLPQFLFSRGNNNCGSSENQVFLDKNRIFLVCTYSNVQYKHLKVRFALYLGPIYRFIYIV